MIVSKKAGVALAAAATMAIGVGGAAASMSASAAPVVHVIRFVAVQTGSHNLGPRTFASTDVERHRGRVTGYDVVNGTFNRHTQRASLWVAASRRGGLIYVKGTETQSGVFTGRVTGGTGKYHGARGTVKGHQLLHHPNKTAIIVTWHL